MTQFLKLSSRIINVKQISEIIIKQTSYEIIFVHPYVLSKNIFFTYTTTGFTINKENKPDYNVVTEWLKKIE